MNESVQVMFVKEINQHKGMIMKICKNGHYSMVGMAVCYNASLNSRV